MRMGVKNSSLAYDPSARGRYPYRRRRKHTQFSRADLADFAYFLAIARHRSFRRAAVELRVSASALSHALKGLESRLNVRLLNRTNRSVTLTAAGEDLLAAISGPFEAIDRASDVLNCHCDQPAGRIRLNVPEDAATLLVGPVMQTFVDRYPDVEIDLTVNNRLIDVIDEGYDAGIRLSHSRDGCGGCRRNENVFQAAEHRREDAMPTNDVVPTAVAVREDAPE